MIPSAPHSVRNHSFGWIAALFSISSLSAATVYIGDDVSGKALTTSGVRADALNNLTYAFTGTGGTYTASTNQSIRLTEVNFLSDEGGVLTPFVAIYNGSGATQGANYNVVSIGDALTVTGGTYSDQSFTLRNLSFTVGGSNPIINLLAGQTLVTGFYQTTRIVAMNESLSGTPNDYIAIESSAIPASVGQTLTKNSTYNLSRLTAFNVGFEVIPEPSTTALGGLALVTLALRRSRTGC